MFDVLVKTTVVTLVAAVLTWRSRHAAAADAHRLWLVVLFSPLIVFAGATVLPPVAFLVPRADVVGATAVGLWSQWMFAAYIAVAIVLLCRIGVGLRAVWRLRRQARALAPHDLEWLRALAGEPHLDVREAELRVPVTAGALRPCVILPRGWRELSRLALTAILRHEAAHVRRRDCAVALAAAAIEAVFWFSPAVWMASARLRWFAEMACDADAEKGMARGEYATELLDLSAAWAGARSPRYAITAGAETHVARRIRLLIDGMERRGRRGPLLPAAIVLVLLAAVLSTAVRVSASRSIESSGWGVDHAAAHSLRHGH